MTRRFIRRFAHVPELIRATDVREINPGKRDRGPGYLWTALTGKAALLMMAQDSRALVSRVKQIKEKLQRFPIPLWLLPDKPTGGGALMKRAAAHAVMAGGLLMLASCISAPAPQKASEPWTPPAACQKSDPVWKEIRAPSSDCSHPLSLAELVDVALKRNPASQRAWNDARAAAAQVDQAQGYFMPTLIGTAVGNRQRTTAEPDGFDQDLMKYGPGLQVNYLIFNFGGGRQAAVEQALQTVYALNFQFNRSIQDILLAVETAYYGLLSAESGVMASEASVKDARTTLEAACESKAAGTGTDLDILQTQAALDQALYQLAGAKGQVKTARGNLARTLGLPADQDIQVAAPTADMPDTLNGQDMRRLIDEALNRRPDISSLRATLAAKKAAVKVAGSGLWPSLYLNGNLNRDYYTTYGGKDFQENDWAYGAGLSLQWTLFDGLQTLSAKRAAAAQAESVHAQLKQAELSAAAEVWTRYYAYETALEKNTFSEAYLKSATASYDLALISYQGGLKSIIDLLNAENQLAQARTQQVASRQDAFTALASLAHATGLLEAGGASSVRRLFSTPTPKDPQP